METTESVVGQCGICLAVSPAAELASCDNCGRRVCKEHTDRTLETELIPEPTYCTECVAAYRAEGIGAMRAHAEKVRREFTKPLMA